MFFEIFVEQSSQSVMLDNFLIQIGLIDNLTSILKIDKYKFFEKLKVITAPGGTDYFSSVFEAFSSASQEYKGNVTPEFFKIRRKRRFLNYNAALATAGGTIVEVEGGIVIRTKINGFSSILLFPLIFLALFYTVFIGIVLNSDGDAPLFILPFLLFQGGIIFFVLYSIAKQNVQRFSYDLEREFYYLTKED